MRLVDSYEKNLISITLLPKGVIKFMNHLDGIVIDIDIQSKRMPPQTPHLTVFISRCFIKRLKSGKEEFKPTMTKVPGVSLYQLLTMEWLTIEE
jgi:hypothetical protein